MGVASKVVKRHKLYYRKSIKGRGGEVRNLHKTSPSIFLFILTEFINGGGQYRYQKLNANVKTWEDWQPIIIEISKDLTQEYVSNFGFEPTTFSYEGTWKPLVTLILPKINNGKKD